MRYLNHAGTSFPKPDPVHRAVADALRAHPSDHSNIYDSAFSQVKGEFRGAGKSNPFRVVMTSGCTSALALALGDFGWEEKDVLVTSSYEHHALDRMAQSLELSLGVLRKAVPPSSNEPFDLGAFEQVLATEKVRLVALTHASNITGELLPLEQISTRARERGVSLLVDAAQTFGTHLFEDAVRYGDIIVAAGHKSALGPQGIGVLAARASVSFRVPGAACELGEKVCGSFPGFCDVGSVNVAGLSGLSAGLTWSKEAGRDKLGGTSAALAHQLREALSESPRFELLGPADHCGMPTVSFVVRETALREAASWLMSRGAFVRAGTHCAPQALATLGRERGCIRVSFGPLNTEDDLSVLLSALKKF